jgi:hypothetical protein
MFDKYQPVELPTGVHEDSRRTRGPADPRLPAETMVLGVAAGNHVRAYPLEAVEKAGLIYEIVEGQPAVVLWFGPTRTAAAYRAVASAPAKNPTRPRPVTLTLDAHAKAAPYVDKETGSRWDIAGRAVDGPLRGWTLEWLDGTQVKWFAWAAEYPETSLYGR